MTSFYTFSSLEDTTNPSSVLDNRNENIQNFSSNILLSNPHSPTPKPQSTKSTPDYAKYNLSTRSPLSIY